MMLYALQILPLVVARSNEISVCILSVFFDLRCESVTNGF